MGNVEDKEGTIDRILISRVVGDKTTKTKTKTKIRIIINKMVDKGHNLTVTVIDQGSYQEEEDKASTNKISLNAITRLIGEDCRVINNNALEKIPKIMNKYFGVL